jgi:hypothetical protein
MVPYLKKTPMVKKYLLKTILLKGIVSQDGVLTETIRAQFRPKQSAAYLSPRKSHVKNLLCNKQGNC